MVERANQIDVYKYNSYSPNPIHLACNGCLVDFCWSTLMANPNMDWFLIKRKCDATTAELGELNEMERNHIHIFSVEHIAHHCSARNVHFFDTFFVFQYALSTVNERTSQNGNYLCETHISPHWHTRTHVLLLSECLIENEKPKKKNWIESNLKYVPQLWRNPQITVKVTESAWDELL